MSGLLAIETATEACSVALYRDGQFQQSHEVAPRQHSQRLFAMLDDLLAQGGLRPQGIEAVAYGCGPGSFTGLRIAASAVQGLCYAAGIPAVPVSTLACQAATAAREKGFADGDSVLSVIDARINEVYFALYELREGRPVEVQAPRATRPGAVEIPPVSGKLHGVGSGCALQRAFPRELVGSLASIDAGVLPQARDLASLALGLFEQGCVQAPADVQPVYVRDEINWKKLPQQGKRQ